ncbi:MAG: hypothetical protein J7576_11245 [Siphonobacter aquaeclarae]|nr:hypothetical protein [Siphonobacter aquaeclarae]
MKKRLLLLLLLTGCRPQTQEPVARLLAKVWKAREVRESTTLVYVEGGTANIKPGYARFSLDLSNPPRAVLTDIDGKAITGTWTLSTDNKRLILSDLVPQPTGTVSIIEYDIRDEPTESELHLERTAESRKTGNSLNEYRLIPK